MKSLVFTVFFAFTVQLSYSQVVILLDEDFNSGFPSAWQVIDNDGLTPHASVSEITSGFGYLEDDDSTGIGDSIVACTSYFVSGGTADNYLITPQIVLENNGNSLYWDVKSQDPSYPDGYEVLVSTTLPVIDSFKVDTNLFYTDAELPYWTQRSVSLDDYEGQTVYIAFHHFSNDQFVLKFDNIRITADTLLSVSERQDNLSFEVYPNPAAEIIYFQLKNDLPVDHLAVYNIHGEQVYTENNIHMLNVSLLSEGMYFVELISGNRRGMKRVVVVR